jgi:hypothetical protein
MNAGLPCISEQKRLPYRPSVGEVDSLYRVINRNIFDNQLTQPPILIGQMKKAWGRCLWHDDRQRRSSWGKPGTWCEIELMDKYISPQWFCTTLAHEMVHQWQWDIYRWQHKKHWGREMFLDSGAHGPSFYLWREHFAEWGIPLKSSHGQRRWYRHQDLFKA